MSKNESVIIFPYDSHFAPILRSKGFIDSYKNIYLSSLLGWGLCGKDGGYADAGQDVNIIVENKFEEYFNMVDTIIFVNPDNYIELERTIYPRMISAINAGKNIICLINIDEKLTEIEERCREKNVRLEYYKGNKIAYPSHNSKRREGLLHINIPIISVIGISENTHKFSLQLQLKEHFESMGYKAVLVGSRSYCEFLGFESFPSFMSENNISEAEKIYYFNKYIKSIETEKNPDIIIIGVPGGILPYNNLIDNNFGITAFEVFQAVVPDASILSIFHEMYSQEYFEALSQVVKYRFGFEIDAFNIANRQIDWVEMENAKPDRVRYATLSTDFMDMRMAECKMLTDKPLYNVQNEGDALNLAQAIVDKLAGNETGIVF